MLWHPMLIWLILKLPFENLFSYLSYWSSWGYIHTDMYTAAIGSGEGKDQSMYLKYLSSQKHFPSKQT